MFTPLMGEVRMAQTVPGMQFGGGWIVRPGRSAPAYGPGAPKSVYQVQAQPVTPPAPAQAPPAPVEPRIQVPMAAVGIFALAAVAVLALA